MADYNNYILEMITCKISNKYRKIWACVCKYPLKGDPICTSRTFSASLYFSASSLFLLSSSSLLFSSSSLSLCSSLSLSYKLKIKVYLISFFQQYLKKQYKFCGSLFLPGKSYVQIHISENGQMYFWMLDENYNYTTIEFWKILQGFV